MRRILFVPDCHRPYHSESAWKLLLKVGKAFKPHRIVVLGDFGDFYATSGHRKDPNRARNLEYEIDSCNEGLDDLESIGAEDHDFVQGNHEENLERYLADRAPELFNMVRVQSLFRLKKRGWSYTPYRQHLRVGRLYVTHDTGNAGPVAHQKALEAFQGNAVIGHTHRMGVHYAGNAKGACHVGAMFGWLGDASHATYAHNIQKRYWQNGCGIGYLEGDGTIHLQAIPFINGRCVLNGTVIRATSSS